MILALILFSTLAVSFVSFVGLFFHFLKINLRRTLSYLLSLAVGALLGAAFFDLLPESAPSLGQRIFPLTLSGIFFFYLLEKIIYEHTCHEDHCEEHPFTYLVLLGDTLHNFVDGLILAASFLTSPALGLSAFVAVSLHEIPHEIGDFSLLIKGGFSRRKALFYNFLSALAAVGGGIIGYFFLSFFQPWVMSLLPLIAGGFIYLALVDITPQLHRPRKPSRFLGEIAMMLGGAGFLWLL